MMNSTPNLSILNWILVCLAGLSAFSAHGQTNWDAQGNPNINWSNLVNWSDDLSPVSKAVTFGSTGTAPAVGTVTSIVDGNYAINSLSLTHSGTGVFHRLQIGAENTLTIGSSAASGNVFAIAGASTAELGYTTFTGGGALVINSANQNFLMQNTQDAATPPMVLNLSGLGSFEANVNQFNVGYGSGRSRADLILSAGSNKITANVIRIANASGNGGGANTLKLGATNEFNANTIVIAAGRSNATVDFQTGLVDPTFKIRGKAGGDNRANLVLGNNSTQYSASGGGSTNSTAVMNLSGVGAEVDFLLTDLVLGIGGSVASNTIGHGIGTLSFDKGTVDATNVILGLALNINNTGTDPDNGTETHGTLNVQGGIFRAGNISIGENRDTDAVDVADINAFSRGRLNISGGVTTVTNDIVLGSHLGNSTGVAEGIVSLTGGTVTVGGNIIEGGGDGALNLSTLTLDGATLDMTGGVIDVDTFNFSGGILKNVGEINNGAGLLVTATVQPAILDGLNTYTGGTMIQGILHVGNGGNSGNLGAGPVTLSGPSLLAFNRSDLLIIDQSIEGGVATSQMMQMGTGRTVLTQANVYGGNTTVAAGVLEAQHVAALGNSRRLTVQSGGAFHAVLGATGAANLQVLTLRDIANNLVLADGSTIGVEIGSSISTNNRAAVVSGGVTLKLFGSSNFAVDDGMTYNFLNTGTGGGLNGASYGLQVYNATNFSVSSLNTSDTLLSVTLNQETELASAYWLGEKVAGNGNVWAISNGTVSNWASDAAGTATAVVPGASTNVIVAATGAVQQQAMTLGADMNVKSLTINDASAVGIADSLYRLTLNGVNGAGNTLEAGATSGAVVLDLALELAGAAPVISVNNAGGVTINGVLYGSNGFAKTGAGVLTLGGLNPNLYSGTVAVNEGLLVLAKTSGVAIAGDLVIGDGTGMDTVRLDGVGQIAATVQVTVNAGGVLNMNGFSDALNALAGGGTVTNSGAGMSILTLGAAGGGGNFGGIIEGGVGGMSVVKQGEGGQTLSGTNTYVGGTQILEGTLHLGANHVLANAGEVLVSGATSTFDVATFSDVTGKITLENGGTIAGTTGVLSSGVNFDLRDGTVSAILGGTTQLVKTTAGTLNLSGANVYTGTTAIEAGTVNLLSGGSIGAGSTAGSLRVGNGATASLIAQAGSSLKVGSGSGSVLHVGVHSSSTVEGVSYGLLDLSALNNFTATVGQFYMGVNSGGSNVGSDRGVVILAANNHIVASTQVLMGHSNNYGNNGPISSLTLGSGLSVFETPLMTVGGRKSDAKVNIAAGGTWNLSNGSTGQTTLYVARNDVNTGTVTTGEVDLTGGALVANLALLSVGEKTAGGNGGAEGKFITGANAGNLVRVEELRVGYLSAGGNANAKGNGSFTWNGGALSAGQINLGVFTSTLGTARGELILNGGLVTVDGNISDGGGTSLLTLNGAILDMTGGAIGSATNAIDTLLLQSGTLRNVGEINGGAGLVKTGAGMLILDGVNTYTGLTHVNEGRLWVTSKDGMNGTSGVNVAAGATFDYSPGAGQRLELDTLSLANGSTIGAEVVDGSIVVSNATTVAGTVTVNVFGSAGTNYNDGQAYLVDIIKANGGSLGNTSYVLGNYYNQTNFVVNSVGGDVDSIFVNITGKAQLAEVYWRGGFAGSEGVWSVSNGTTTSNWTLDSAGITNTPMVPGSATNVIFSANNAAASSQAAMSLGANMNIGTLTFADTDAATLQDTAYQLVLHGVDAITLLNGAGAVKLNTNLLFANANALVEVDDGSGGLELGWMLTGSNGFTKMGDGTLTLSGTVDNNHAGQIAVQEGVLVLAKESGYDAISTGLVVESGGTARLGESGQFADTAWLQLNGTGVFDLNGFTAVLDELLGNGVVSNSAATAGVLRIGQGGGSGTFNGLIENGTGGVSVEKVGAGVQTIGGTHTFTGLTRVSEGTLLYGSNNVLAGDVTVSGATAVLNIAQYNDEVGLVTLSNGGAITGTTGVLSSTANFNLLDGAVSANLGGNVGIKKLGTGTVTMLSAGNVYTGVTAIDQGTLVIGANQALPQTGVVTIGSGGTVGKLDLTNASQTIGSLTFSSISTATYNEVVIGAGQKLSITGADSLKVGLTGQAGRTTNVRVAGAGTLEVLNSAGLMEVGIRNSDQGAAQNDATLDLRELGLFKADVNQLRVGYESKNAATLWLSNTANYITANVVSVGNSGVNNSGNRTELRLGAGENIIAVTQLDIGRGKQQSAAAKMDFGTSTGTLLLTGKTPGTGVNINIGRGSEVNTAAIPTGILDLAGHRAIVVANTVAVGYRDQGGTGGAVGTLNFNQGTFSANQLLIGTRTTGGTVSGTVNIGGGVVEVNTAVRLGSSSSGGTASAVLNLTGGTFISRADIVDGGGAGTTNSRLTLDGAVLDMSGKAIGSAAAANIIDTLEFKSGELRNVSQINLGAGLTKTTAGLLKLSGVNTYTGTTNVNAGTLLVTSVGAMNGDAKVVVSSGARFDFAAGGGTLNLDSLSLAGGSSIGAELGTAVGAPTKGSIRVDDAVAVSAAGAISVNVYGVNGVVGGGTHVLVNADAGGLTSGGASYSLGKVYNATNFAITPGSLTATNTQILIGTTAVAGLTEAYWYGGFGGDPSDWAVSDGGGLSGNSNWVKDAVPAGNNTGLVPGEQTNVIFAANGASNQGAMTMSTNMSLGSLTFNDTADMTLNGTGRVLTLNNSNAITANAGAGDVELKVGVNFANALSVVAVADTGRVTISGVLSGNAFSKTGAGTLRLAGAGANTFTGKVVVSGGVLELAKVGGTAAITGDLDVGNGSGAARVVLMGSEQVANSAALTMGTDGALDLNGHAETIGVLNGSGRILNGSAGTSTLAVAGSGTFSGVLDEQNGAIELTKSGAGTLTLSGTEANTNSGLTRVTQGTLTLAKADGVVALGSSEVLVQTTGSGVSVLRLAADEQLNDDAVVRLNATGGNNAGFDLNGHEETIGGVVLETTTNAGATMRTGTGGVLTMNGDIEFNMNRNATSNSARHLLITGTGTVGTAAVNSGVLDLGGAVRNIAVNANAAAQAFENTDATIETVIRNGGINKTGTERLYLTGTNTYSGTTTVSAGTLLVNGSHSGGSNYSVAAGAVLGGSGSINLASGSSVSVTGALSVGNFGDSAGSSLEIVTSGGSGLVFNNNSYLNLDIYGGGGHGSNVSAAHADYLDLQGALGVGINVGLRVSMNIDSMIDTWVAGDTWRLIDWNGLNYTGQQFEFDFELSEELMAKNLSWDLSDLYVGGTVSLAVVPEPSRVLLIFVGGMLFFLRRKR